jgi:hypothetical protein
MRFSRTAGIAGSTDAAPDYAEPIVGWRATGGSHSPIADTALARSRGFRISKPIIDSTVGWSGGVVAGTHPFRGWVSLAGLTGRSSS